MNSMAIVAQKKAFQRFWTVNLTELTSIAMRIPPIGVPKVQTTPTATAASKN